MSFTHVSRSRLTGEFQKLRRLEGPGRQDYLLLCRQGDGLIIRDHLNPLGRERLARSEENPCRLGTREHHEVRVVALRSIVPRRV